MLYTFSGLVLGLVLGGDLRGRCDLQDGQPKLVSGAVHVRTISIINNKPPVNCWPINWIQHCSSVTLTPCWEFNLGHSLDSKVGKTALSMELSLDSVYQVFRMSFHFDLTDLNTPTSRGWRAWEVFGGKQTMTFYNCVFVCQILVFISCTQFGIRIYLPENLSISGSSEPNNYSDIWVQRSARQDKDFGHL